MWRRCVGMLAVLAGVVVGATSQSVRADGKLVRLRDYHGSLEEQAQEAIIVFHGSEQPGEAVEDLILKITVEGAIDRFAWVIPFPNQPQTAPEDAKLFAELFQYVQLQQARLHAASHMRGAKSADAKKGAPAAGVKVLSREVVGSYDVAVVREHEPGTLNAWLVKEGYQPLDNAQDVLDFYRQKKYVYACIKVDQTQLAEKKRVELHPLRFTFKTGGRDAIYFPMKLTGLQTAPFDVNLYVFYRYWLNDQRNFLGYEHRGFKLNYRDWDSPSCEANAGKAYSAPTSDDFLDLVEYALPQTTAFFQKLHPGERYYLTNLQAKQLSPADVRQWADDLWLFPYYTDRKQLPHDAAEGGVAAGQYPRAAAKLAELPDVHEAWEREVPWWIPYAVAVAAAAALLTVHYLRRRHVPGRV